MKSKFKDVKIQRISLFSEDYFQKIFTNFAFFLACNTTNNQFLITCVIMLFQLEGNLTTT